MADQRTIGFRRRSAIHSAILSAVPKNSPHSFASAINPATRLLKNNVLGGPRIGGRTASKICTTAV
jgi:hypothetical protein